MYTTPQIFRIERESERGDEKEVKRVKPVDLTDTFSQVRTKPM